MKLSIGKEHILQGLQAVQNVVGTRTTLPILSNVLLKADDNRLELTATDLDVTISCSVEARVQRPGGTTIPVKKFFGICRELGQLEIDLETDEHNLSTLSAGNSYYRINGLAAQDFPPIPEFADKKHVSLPQEKLRGMLKKTSFAISTDESRYVLNGIFHSFKEHRVTLVSTDGRRLALVEEEVEVEPESHGDFIVPTKAINELSRLLQPSGDVSIRYTDNQVAYELKGDKHPAVRIVSKLVEGTYPNYRQVIPTEFKERVPVIREELLQALRRAEIMTSDKTNSVKLSFTRNNLAITANTPEVGEGRESLAINYAGADIAIAFNPVYLMDPLKALDSDEVYIEISDDLSPGVVKTNSPFLYVIMPMRMA
ncbi:MAG: DNA polymerase III subunit beta [Verrucomicrobiae bacterium]|nr:DNA polymerase III subunit beta [Verrucomicrobiae bacterium]